MTWFFLYLSLSCTAMEVDEAKINNETGKSQGKNSRKVALFDLNLEPPEDDDADA